MQQQQRQAAVWILDTAGLKTPSGGAPKWECDVSDDMASQTLDVPTRKGCPETAVQNAAAAGEGTCSIVAVLGA